MSRLSVGENPPDEMSIEPVYTIRASLSVTSTPEHDFGPDLVFCTGGSDFWEVDMLNAGYGAAKKTNERVRLDGNGNMFFRHDPVMESYPFQTREFAEIFVKLMHILEGRSCQATNP